MQVEVSPDADAAAGRAADLVADVARRAVRERGAFTWAISGGATPASTFRMLGALDIPWDAVATWQVDERVAPLADADRNRTGQSRSLPPAAVERVRWMPVEDEDLEGAAARYASSLPERFDLVQLGLGADGHTASLVPGDPVLGVRDRDVAVSRPYGGRRRMTLTYPGLERAARALWLVVGPEKREALTRLLAGDGSIPAARVRITEQTLIVDRTARPVDEVDHR